MNIVSGMRDETVRDETKPLQATCGFGRRLSVLSLLTTLLSRTVHAGLSLFCILHLASFAYTETKSLGTPAIETGNWTSVQKVLKPSGGWGLTVSSGISMVYISTPGGGNWYVKISTSVDFDNDGTPDPLLEGNEYEYNYLTYENPYYFIEQTTRTRSVSIPNFDPADTSPSLVVNDNFGYDAPPPQSVTGFFTETSTNQFTVTVQWSAPTFSTKRSSSTSGTFSTVSGLSIKDLSLNQIWRSTSSTDANTSTATYSLKTSVLSSDPLEFNDNDALDSEATYYYVLRTLDAYDPPTASRFSDPIGVFVKSGISVAVKIYLTVDVKALSGASSSVFVTVKINRQAKNILTRAPLTYNGDGTWSITFIEPSVIAGRRMQYRYGRSTVKGEELEPDQQETASKEHEFVLSGDNPMVDQTTVPWVIRIKDRWGVPTYDTTPRGMPLTIAGISISSGVFEVGIGSGDAISVAMDQKAETALHADHANSPSCAAALVWYSVTSTGPFVAIPHPSLPDVKVYFGTSTESGSKLWDVSESTSPGYGVMYSTVNGVLVPLMPCKAFYQPIARLFVKSANSFYKFQAVDTNGNTSGNASQAIKVGEEVPKWVDISTVVSFSNTLALRNGKRTGEIQMSWVAPTAISTHGAAHHYDVWIATSPIQTLSALRKAKMVGRLEAAMSGSAENFATVNLGETSPGYHFAVVPIYGDWSKEAKVVIQFGKLGVAPKMLNVNSKPKDRQDRRIVKGAIGATELGRKDIGVLSAEAELRANLEIPRGGIELSQAMAVIKNARESAGDTAVASMVEKAAAEAANSQRRISKDFAALNVVGENATDSSVVSYEVSDLGGTSYFSSDKKVSKLPLVISIPIPATWDKDNDGIVDITRGTDREVRMKDLRVYRLNTKGNYWELVREGKNQKSETSSVVTAEVKHLSTFALFAPGGPKNDLSELVVYPNPYVPYDDNCQNGYPYNESCGSMFADQSGITFDNLTKSAEVFIYTLTMDLVRRFRVTESNLDERSGKWRWDGRNDSGDSVASGLYIYMVKDDSAGGVNKKTGKLVIVR